MPRFSTPISGPSEQELDALVDPAFPAIDRGRELIVAHAAKLEQTRLRGARRELSRLEYQQGADSAAAKLAAESVRASQRRLVVLQLEMERLRVGGVKVSPTSVIVHGHVLDANHRGQPNLTVALSDAGGNRTAKTKTDERGYFKLESAPIPGAAADTVILAPGGGSTSGAAGGQSYLLVLDGEREIYREEMGKLDAGQTRYREIVLKARS